MRTCTSNVEGSAASTANRTGYRYEAYVQKRQNLRDRLYDARTGRFTQSDRYEGSNSDPASLHKYVYTHGNPINGIDPSGQMQFSMAGMLMTGAISGLVAANLVGWYGYARNWSAQEILHAQATAFAVGFSVGAAAYAGVIAGGTWVSTKLFGLSVADAWVGQWFVAWHLGILNVSVAQVQLAAAYEDGDEIDQRFAWLGLGLALAGQAGLIAIPARASTVGLEVRDTSFIGNRVSAQRQARHLDPTMKSAMKSLSDAQKVVDEFHDGQVKVLASSPSEHRVVVQSPTVKGQFRNPRYSRDEPSDIFVIEGRDSAKVYPANPDMGER